MAKGTGKRRIVRWGIGVLTFIIVLSGATVGAMSTGAPQEWLVEWGAKRFAGLVVDAEGVEFFRRVHLDSITIYPDAQAMKNGEKFAIAEGVDITVALSELRRIPSVHIDTLNVSVSAREASSNTEFIMDLLASDDTETDDTWIPEVVRIDSLWAMVVNDAGSADLMGIEFDAAIHSSSDINARLHGTVANGLHVRVESDDTTMNASFEAMNIDLNFALKNDNATVQGTIEKAGELEARVDAAIALSGDAPVLTMNDFAFDVYSSGWDKLGTPHVGEWYADLSHAELSMKEARWTLDGKAYPTARISAAIRDLDLYDRVGSLFTGDIAVQELMLTGGDTLSVQGQTQLNEDLVCLLDAFNSADEQRATIHFENWPKTSMVAATPDDFRGWFEDLAFDTLSGTAGVHFTGYDFGVAADVNSTSAQGDAPVGLNVLLSGKRGHISGTTGELVLSLGKGKVAGRGELTAEGDYVGTLKIESMPLRPFTLLALGARLPEDFKGAIDGEVTLNQPGDSVDAIVNPKITISEFGFNEIDQPDVVLSGAIVVDTETRIAKSDSITLATPNDELGVVLNETVYALDVKEFDSRMDVSVDLGWFDTLSNAGGLFGTMKLLGTVEGENGIWSVNFEGESDDISYGDLLLPYGSLMTAQGTVRVTEASLLTELVDTTVMIDEGSRVVIPQATYVEDVFSGDATMESDLAILVGMAYVEAVEGSVTGEASWIMGSDTNIDWETQGAITALTLPENAGTASEVTFAMNGAYSDAFTGAGTIEAVGISASGATVHNTSGALGFEDGVLVISDAKSGLFEGTLSSRVGVRILDEGIPVRYDGTFEDISLAQLTIEVQPPNTKMTGLAHGELEADYSVGSGLKGFELDVVSDGDFTINRSLVEEMMQMQTVLKGLGERKAQQTMAKFLGEAPQRPFDSAEMNLFLVDEVIQGVAILKSEKTKDYNGLNLTVQLSIDKPALANALKMLENSSMTELDF